MLKIFGNKIKSTGVGSNKLMVIDLSLKVNSPIKEKVESLVEGINEIYGEDVKLDDVFRSTPIAGARGGRK